MPWAFPGPELPQPLQTRFYNGVNIIQHTWARTSEAYPLIIIDIRAGIGRFVRADKDVTRTKLVGNSMFQSKDWGIEIGSLQVDVETRLAIRGGEHLGYYCVQESCDNAKARRNSQI